MKGIFNERRDDENNFQYMAEAFFRGAEIINFTRQFNFLYYMLSMKGLKQETIDEEVSELRKAVDEFFKDYNVPTDLKITKAMFKIYRENIPAQQQPSFYETVRKKYRGNIP